MITDRKPFFVYGTLRPGHYNAERWGGAAIDTDDGNVLLSGYRLTTAGMFPYAVEADSTQDVVGCLVWPYAEEYDDVLASFDSLEGHPTHYLRTPVEVTIYDDDGDTTGTIEALTYIAAQPWPSEYTSVLNNDWVEHCAARVSS